MKRVVLVAWGLWLCMLVAPRAEAFCGFYVAGADAELFADATQVVLMRDGQRTVVAMRNAYAGPAESFAMVVPVPVVLGEDDVKVLPAKAFDRVDALAAPRLVEYWEQDPCPKEIGLGGIGTLGHGAGTGTGFGSGHGRLGRSQVRVEAEFAVGEYDIVILSADDSAALETWLRDHDYAIPDGAEPYLRPYVAQKSKFFVAKVDPAKVTFEGGRAKLSPLRFHYDADRFSLPVRLGRINARGAQDLIVHVIARDRYRVANYPEATIPTNLDVKPETRGSFGAFYTSLFEEALGPQRDHVVTEYAWSPTTCDPCPTDVLDDQELLTLGADVLPSLDPDDAAASPMPTVRMRRPKVTGALPEEVVMRIVRQNFGRFRLCYEEALKRDQDLEGEVSVRFTIDAEGGVKTPAGSGMEGTEVAACVTPAIAGLTFPPPEGGTVDVVYPLRFSPRRGFATGFARGFVLTRLHARFDEGALGEDLVFEKAPPIMGGREQWTGGVLEQGATEASINNFQARYAIRHRWTGAVECDDPQRGVWGGPPADVDPARTKPVAATGLGFAPAGGAKAQDFLQGAPPGASPPAASSAPAAPGPSAPPHRGATRSPHPAGCRCEAPGGDEGGPWAWLLAVGVLGIAARRRA